MHVSPNPGMDQFLFDKYEQLNEIYDRIEYAMRRRPDLMIEHLKLIVDDIRKMRDDARSEYDEF